MGKNKQAQPAADAAEKQGPVGGEVETAQAPAQENAAPAEETVEQGLSWKIVTDPSIRFGMPTFEGSRLSPIDLVQLMSAGATDDEILADYSSATPERLVAARQWWQSHGLPADLVTKWAIPPAPEKAAPAEEAVEQGAGECPVKVRALPDGEFIFTDAKGRQRLIAQQDMNLTMLATVFEGREDYLAATWSLQKEGVIGIDSAKAWAALMAMARHNVPLVVEADEDAAQLADHMGPTIYETEWNACLTLAFKGASVDMLTDWGPVPAALACFMVDNPGAPEEAALIHVKRTLKVAVLPNEDPDRVKLALMLFRCFIVGMEIIDREAAEKRRLADEAKGFRYAAAAAQAAYQNAPSMLSTEDGPFSMEQGGLAAPSDFALKR